MNQGSVVVMVIVAEEEAVEVEDVMVEEEVVEEEVVEEEVVEEEDLKGAALLQMLVLKEDPLWVG